MAAPEPLAKELQEATRFTRFSALPPELRHMIWAFALPPDTQELHILQTPNPAVASAWVQSATATSTPASIPSALGPAPAFLTVQTGYPVLMHASREARRTAQSRTTLTWSEEARCAIPTRAFRPDMDILYMPWFSFRGFFRQAETFPSYRALTPQLRHVAIDAVVTDFPDRLVDSFRYLRSLRTLHVLFGSATGPFRVEEALRFRRREVWAQAVYADGDAGYVFEEARQETESMLLVAGENGGNGPGDGDGDDDDHGLPGGIGVWDPDRRTLKLDIVADVFTEYCASAEGSPWVEKGKESMTDLATSMEWNTGRG
ncbi:Uu.00g068400.m01.CDS01 [Anthostomella pinea]|uniref:Uu.00g068400.m01.CDS01 n=1 Tax=Anthostomella pinea TaxID=933095 RepID=A0AAI8VUY6_9PEZI|nr:Uu.00g068400.m01.CDS01 [Anthostomella pinea]